MTVIYMNYDITVYGLVQGIGFRPYVAETAHRMHLAGIVSNCGGVVRICLYGCSEDEKDTFIRSIRENVPRGGRVDRVDVIVGDIRSGDTVGGSTVDRAHTAGEQRFRIIESSDKTDYLRFLPPDIATCDTCLREMSDPANRRYHHPFISCTVCGPRYTIMKSIPYDREVTTMAAFDMCEDCRREYTEQGNIRRHAQTIACRRCGPRLSLYVSGECLRVLEECSVDKGFTDRSYSRNSRNYSDGREACAEDFDDGKHDAARVNVVREDFGSKQLYRVVCPDEYVLIQCAATLLNHEMIGAVKDIGGFHFALSPYSDMAARRMRVFKNREEKPFAVIYPNVDAIKLMCEVSDTEEKLLTSSVRPIVLLNRRCDSTGEQEAWHKYASGSMPERSEPSMEGFTGFSHLVSGRSSRIGAFLPCNPVQAMLTELTGSLVMTSGNRGDEPIIIRDDDMLRLMDDGCPDFVLTHNREILTPADDSIYQVTKLRDREVVQCIRRARGLVPEPIIISDSVSKHVTGAVSCDAEMTMSGREDILRKSGGYEKRDIFAAGGDMKNTFALARGGAVYLSQHFGDMGELSVQEARLEAYRRMKKLLGIEPEVFAADMHPGYVSTDMRDIIGVDCDEGKESRLGDATVSVSYGGNDASITKSGNLSQKSESDVAVRLYQHHKAHMAAVMAEHGLRGDILGIIYDGTGYGEDGGLWGGEFIASHGLRSERVRGLFEPVRIVGTDEGARDARMTAMCYLYSACEKGVIGRDEYELYVHKLYGTDASKAHQRITALDYEMRVGSPRIVRSTSVGRLFDAVSAVLGICSYNSYEGQCPVMLEEHAHMYAAECGNSYIYGGNTDSTKHTCAVEYEADIDSLRTTRTPEEWIARACRLMYAADGTTRAVNAADGTTRAVHAATPVDRLAYEFHTYMIEKTVKMAETICIPGLKDASVVLGGGTFNNRILTAGVMAALEERGYRVYISEKVPCGDGGLALGQVYMCMMGDGAR